VAGPVRGAGSESEGRVVCLHRGPMRQIRGFLYDVLTARQARHLEAELTGAVGRSR